MAAVIPMLIGSVAAYAQKKTEKPYFLEQSVAGVAGYSIGLVRVLTANNTYITRGNPVWILVAPALVSGMGWSVGRITGKLVGDGMAGK